MNEFVTIKIRSHLHHWLKVRSAASRVPMYEMIEMLMSTGRGRPWEYEDPLTKKENAQPKWLPGKTT